MALTHLHFKTTILFSSPSSYHPRDAPKPKRSASASDEIESKFREALNGSNLSNFSVQELNLFLSILDPMMIEDINRTMETYNEKKEPIIEVKTIHADSIPLIFISRHLERSDKPV